MFLGLDENRRGLKSVLENKKILKLIHDCRNDWDSLLHQYSVRIYNFIDTQEAYFIFKLFFYQEITLPVSLLNFIENMLKIKLEHKNKFKKCMNEDPLMWGIRPMPEEQLAYAAEDVFYLIKAWLFIREKINDNLKENISFLTILKVVDYPVFGQFKEYLISNVIYFSMLENVFDANEVYKYIFNMDYVYNFLQIKLMLDTKIQFNESNGNQMLSLPDENYYNFVREKRSTLSILESGLNFKHKQRFLSLKKFKDDEMSQCYFNNNNNNYGTNSVYSQKNNFTNLENHSTTKGNNFENNAHKSTTSNNSNDSINENSSSSLNQKIYNNNYELTDNFLLHTNSSVNNTRFKNTTTYFNSKNNYYKNNFQKRQKFYFTNFNKNFKKHSNEENEKEITTSNDGNKELIHISHKSEGEEHIMKPRKMFNYNHSNYNNKTKYIQNKNKFNLTRENLKEKERKISI